MGIKTKRSRKLRAAAAVLLCLLIGAGTLQGVLAAPDTEDSAAEESSMPAEASQEAGSGKDPAEMYQELLAMPTDEEKQAYFDSLTEEERKAAEDYQKENDPEEEHSIPDTVEFTDAAPFMAPVSFGSQIHKAPAAKDSGTADSSGVEQSKTVTEEADGSYLLTLKAYVTGKTTTTKVEKAIPVDIVLVLDQSGSMRFDFDGNDNVAYADSRQKAMKDSVTSFIDAVAQKNKDSGTNNRMAIVTYGSDSTVLQGWTTVDDVGKTALTNAIGGLPEKPQGATNTGAGMQNAATLMGSGYNYTPTEDDLKTGRQKVVILFTDGIPTTTNTFDTTVANTAITSAKTMKDEGVTVYSVGIFNGADPDQKYGASGFDQNSNGTVGSHWANRGGSISDDDISTPAGNRFLNFVSSNYPDASEIGLKEYSSGFWIFGYGGWQITKNFSSDKSGYYLTAADEKNLSNIFSSISENIQSGTATVELTETTVVKDVISEQFSLPEGATKDDIHIYTADYKADGTFGPMTERTDLTPAINGKTVTVTGFDFSANYCDTSYGRDEKDPKKMGSFYGRELIITIPIIADKSFLGGGPVATNAPGSGIYSGDGTMVEEFDRPTVEVDVPATMTLAAADHDVYLTTEAAGLLMADKATLTTEDGTVFTLDSSKDNFGIADPSYAAVTVSGVADSGETVLTKDTDYTLTVTITPAEENGKARTFSAKGHIDVYRPVVTFKDSVIDIGSTADYETENLVEAGSEWDHDGDKAPDDMTGKPDITLAYTPEETAFQVDTPVKAAAYIDTTDITDLTYFKRLACDQGDNPSDSDVETAGKDSWTNFVVHVNRPSFDLTIRSSGWNSKDKGQSFVYKVAGKDGSVITVSIAGNGDAVIKGLPIGEYTVTPVTAWSWRYTPDASERKVTENDIKAGKAEVSFVNTRTDKSWLKGGDKIDNRWGD